jgi:hypothetical protein
VNSELKNAIEKWKQPNGEGFFLWLDDIKPKIINPEGKLETFRLQDFQRDMLQGALQTDDQGDFKYQTVIFSLPRRHSKTTCAALLVLYRFCLLPNENIKVISNSERQVLSVNFKMLRNLILNTPALRQWVGAENVWRTEIKLPSLNNLIQAVVTNTASLYGERITCGWFSELHAAGDDEALQVLSSSQGDVRNGQTIIDSTTDPENGPLHQLEMAASLDPTIYVYRKEYKSIDDALKNSPAWINRKWLKSRKTQLLPSVFASQHLNKRSEASNNLFPKDDLDKCKASYKNGIDPKSFEALLDGRKYVCGAGLDRSYMFSKHGDNTIWTSVARTAGDDGEAYYYVLNQKKILGGLGKSIKKEIINDNARYGLKNTVVEAYNSQDLATWATEQGLNNEIIHVTASNSLAAFQDFSALVREGRIFFPAELEDLYKELSHFHYSYNKNGNITFGSSKRKDDRVYSLLWAIYSLRKEETTVYELGDIRCNSLSKHAPYCFLRSGDLILNCADRCPAAVRTKQFLEQYRSNNPETELTLPEFFQRLVKVKGFKTYKAM